MLSVVMEQASRRLCLVLVHYTLFAAYLAVPGILPVGPGLYAWAALASIEGCIIYATLRLEESHMRTRRLSDSWRATILLAIILLTFVLLAQTPIGRTVLDWAIAHLPAALSGA